MYEKFAELLQQHHTTAYQVAKATGIAQSTLSDWKSGRSVPKIDKLQKIADYFAVSVSYFTDDEQKEKPADSGRPKLEDADIAFYERYTQLSEEEKEDMRDFLELMENRRKRREKGE